MCGIAGFLSLPSRRDQPRELMLRRAGQMADAMTARGPDDAGSWADPRAGIALGFRRLAVIDLSPAGHQPMLSASGRYVIVFNGEIYNHRDLKRQLESDPAEPPNRPAADDASHPRQTFRGHSDTEVLLAGIEAWGLEETLRRAVGMFALAVWDRRERALRLARDRMGEKPLYYGLIGGTFLFGSELKALRAHPDFSARVDRGSLRMFMRHGWFPAPRSVYEKIHKLIPGCSLSIAGESLESREIPAPRPYWSVQEAAHRGQANPLALGDVDATAELERMLIESISGQMAADVPVGAFLSGGIDSSTVVALMQSLSSRRVRTFSIGFHEGAFNEAHHALAVAEHLRTEHTEFYVTAEQAQAVIPRLPEIYDEPFADSSQIPTFLVSQLAQREVTVSLSGDGGDELFEGYSRYEHARHLWRIAQCVPLSLRKQIRLALHGFPVGASGKAAGLLASWFGREGRSSPAWHQARRAAAILQCEGFPQLYRHLVSLWSDSDAVVIELDSSPDDPWTSTGLNDIGGEMRYFDQTGYLPDDILVKVDRAAMAVSLESRMPLLDHRVVEFAWRLPHRLLRRHGKAKWLLRQVLYKHVPGRLVERPKMGFGVPIGVWLRGPLRDWAESLLDADALRDDAFLNVPLVLERWREHTSGSRDWQHPLWAVLMFQAWRQHSANQTRSLTQAA